jgi:hypothetical protein
MPHPLKTLSVATILCLLVSCHEEPNDGPTLDGQCGLRGQKVWCNEDADCGNSFAGPYCDYHGQCFSTTPGFYHCAVQPGRVGPITGVSPPSPEYRSAGSASQVDRTGASGNG